MRQVLEENKMPQPILDSFLEALQDACLPAIWSRGVQLSRTAQLICDQKTESEIIIRVQVGQQPVTPKVTLWPEEEDWYCDCGDRNDPCQHIAAATIGWKSGRLENSIASGKTGATTSTSSRSLYTCQIQYHFFEKEEGLFFERLLVSDAKEEKLGQSLVSYIGGLTSGRIQGKPIAASKSDFAVDSALKEKKRGLLDRETIEELIPALSECSHVFLDKKPIRCSTKKISLDFTLKKENSGFRIQRASEAPLQPFSQIPSEKAFLKNFKNGVVLDKDGTLFSLAKVTLTPYERELLSPQHGSFIPSKDFPTFFGTVFPQLQKKISIHHIPEDLPKFIECTPEIILKMENLDDNTLLVFPQMFYGNPPIAQIVGQELQVFSFDKIPKRNRIAEKKLIQKLRDELQVQVDASARFQGEAAIRFNALAKNWNSQGGGRDKFKALIELSPDILWDGKTLQVNFSNSNNDVMTPSEGASRFEKVYEAWKNHSEYLCLDDGHWAKLPSDWMKKYGKQIHELLSRQKKEGALPACHYPELSQIYEEHALSPPSDLQKFKTLFNDFTQIPDAELPPHLQADLRSYQKQGVNWLQFMRQKKIGALLADDMGLGKTLQCLCVMEGKTLIVAPTSVLVGWMEQIKRFRPDLNANLYHGTNRSIASESDSRSEIILTSYSLLRLEKEFFTSQQWNTIILDESQMIKNPDSQTAQAAYSLKGDFKISLSGTPIENRLEDLWSQFHFLNPSLLGTKSEFQNSFISPIQSGEQKSSLKLQRRVRPFILRRLKKDVALELPPKTETILHCELLPEERKTYDSLFLSTQKEVIEKLELENNVMAALEALLRLRQACCHPQLLDHNSPHQTSAKLETLFEKLEESFSEGHRSLVFSQWTRYLDLIEPELQKRRIPFLRLDGATKNRKEIIENFQSKDGPPVLLLSLKAGGVGLNLTSADHVFLLDPWWNPAAEDQAADRTHRIGQNRPVFIYKLVAKDTIEERIIELQQKKAQLAQNILEGADGAIGLKKEDLLSLFQ
jgi:superfamily II DNA or RNA helicase